MKNFQAHYNKLKGLLQNESGFDKLTLREKYNRTLASAYKDINVLDFNDTDRDVISALKHRIKWLHSLGNNDYKRDAVSQLSFFPQGHVSLTFNSHWNERPESELYQPITAFLTDMLNKGGNLGPQDEPFYSGEICNRVSEEQMNVFVQTLTDATHKIANHIIENVSGNWAWKPDILGYSLYTFEKFFDYTYHMIVTKDYVLDFEPTALYEAPVLSMPMIVERRMYEKEDKLYDIIKYLLDFIEETDICNSNNALWIRTVMFNMGLAAFQTVCRTKELE